MKLSRTLCILCLLLFIHTGLRFYLLLSTKTEFPLQVSVFFKIFTLGFLYDLFVTILTIIPFQFFGFRKFFSKKPLIHENNKSFIITSSFLVFFHLTLCICEIVFWKEFQTRFNFIAVDYLIYTQEVLKNIQESYPLPWIFLGLFTTSLMFVIFLKSQFKRFPLQTKKAYFMETVSLITIAIGLYALPLSTFSERLPNPFNEEVSKNGIYFLFQAYFKNELDYLRFYKSLPDKEAFERLKKNYNDIKIGSDPLSFKRIMTTQNSERKMNVIFVSMESMSASFMNSFGSKENITPNLDRLAKEGLFFKKIYSTGTRTVRGLEAFSLSIPPTPGQSIVRRPNNNNLYNISTPFIERNYDVEFLYGGYSYFDNMKEYFSNNQFTIFDRSSMKKEEIIFENAWGVCDEDLYNLSLRNADHSYQNEKPFFQLIMTTSNHRPYTYPLGRIDRLPGKISGRDGVVKYSDYAIGAFLKDASKKPWFKNTLFIFAADHNASVAGSMGVPVRDYKIPVIFYAPGFIKPEVNESLASQIDIIPTLFGILGFKIESSFFGVDLTQFKPNRSFVANFQSLGFMKDGILTLLNPKNSVKQYSFSEDDHQKQLDTINEEYVKDAIAYYQTASQLFKEGKLKK